MKSHHLLAAAALMTAIPTIAAAQGQQVYTQQQSGILGQLLGAVFGASPQASEQVLESDWNQGRRPFAQRRATLDARIDAAVSNGSLNRREADEVRREYDEIVRLEGDYAADGSVSPQQRSDLRLRFRELARRVGGQGYDMAYGQGGAREDGRWQMLSSRSGEFEQRISAGLRSRDLTPTEAMRLRADWRTLSQLEASYQRDGLDQREQADLRARYARLEDGLRGGGGTDGAGSADGRWSDMERRLASAEQTGRLTRNEAAQVRAQLGDLERLDTAYANGGYRAEQQAYLTRRHGELDRMLGADRRR